MAESRLENVANGAGAFRDAGIGRRPLKYGHRNLAACCTHRRIAARRGSRGSISLRFSPPCLSRYLEKLDIVRRGFPTFFLFFFFTTTTWWTRSKYISPQKRRLVWSRSGIGNSRWIESRAGHEMPDDLIARDKRRDERRHGLERRRAVHAVARGHFVKENATPYWYSPFSTFVPDGSTFAKLFSRPIFGRRVFTNSKSLAPRRHARVDL